MGRVKEEYRSLSGPEKASILMLALGEEHAERLFSMMDDEEIKEISQTMSNLGTISSNVVERLFVEFADQISSTGSLVGSYDTTERLLNKVLPDDRVQNNMKRSAAPPVGPCGISSTTSMKRCWRII